MSYNKDPRSWELELELKFSAPFDGKNFLPITSQDTKNKYPLAFLNLTFDTSLKPKAPLGNSLAFNRALPTFKTNFQDLEFMNSTMPELNTNNYADSNQFTFKQDPYSIDWGALRNQQLNTSQANKTLDLGFMDYMKSIMPLQETTSYADSDEYNSPNNPYINRRDTRQIMRQAGLDPYSFTGDTRRSLRRFLQGNYNQYDITRLEQEGIMSALKKLQQINLPVQKESLYDDPEFMLKMYENYTLYQNALAEQKQIQDDQALNAEQTRLRELGLIYNPTTLKYETANNWDTIAAQKLNNPLANRYDVMKWQLDAANAGYDLAVDGKWGDNTQAAYDAYMKNGETWEGYVPVAKPVVSRPSAPAPVSRTVRPTNVVNKPKPAPAPVTTTFSADGFDDWYWNESTFQNAIDKNFYDKYYGKDHPGHLYEVPFRKKMYKDPRYSKYKKFISDKYNYSNSVLGADYNIKK